MNRQRKQRRFTSETQLIKRIDELRQEHQELLQKGLDLDAKCAACEREIADLEVSMAADAWLQLNGVRHKIGVLRDEQKIGNIRRHAIENTHLPKLKDALAAFRTGTLGFTDDPGVVLEPKRT